jgi:hypothetical protein
VTAVEQARAAYLATAKWLRRSDPCPIYLEDGACRWCELDGLIADAASIQLDLVVAEDCARKSVAWA